MAAQVVYTALARMAATAGEPDQALQAARDALAAGVQLRLRSFVPALRTYCAAGDFAGAFEVPKPFTMVLAGVDLPEVVYSSGSSVVSAAAQHPCPATPLTRVRQLDSSTSCTYALHSRSVWVSPGAVSSDMLRSCMAGARWTA